MPDSDDLLCQNEVDVRNEARRVRNEDAYYRIFACRNPERVWIEEQEENAGQQAEDTPATPDAE